jgi:uncharacterized protein YndB with AHSA1/START domain
MATFEERIALKASPAEVFPYLVEPDRLKRWLGGFVESRPLDGTEAGLGAKSVDVIRDNGREVLMHTEIRRYEPPNRLEVSIRAPGMEAVSDYRLAGDETTELTHRQQVRFRGFLRLMAPFIGGAMRRRLADDLARLREAVES